MVEVGSQGLNMLMTVAGGLPPLSLRRHTEGVLLYRAGPQTLGGGTPAARRFTTVDRLVAPAPLKLTGVGKPVGEPSVGVENLELRRQDQYALVNALNHTVEELATPR